jgi:aspartyl-tRNA(Asn)/glutamyl-tRNA(Gln) amidotransferase subunit C
MAVDEKIVARVGVLANIALQPAEIPAFVGELNNILGWIDQLQAVDTGDMKPMDAVMPLTRAWRGDVVTDGDRQADILANAPAAAHGFFGVPKVIE